MTGKNEFYRVPKLPPYVFAVINELRDKARAAGEDVIDLGMGNPDGATPQVVVDALVAAAQDPKYHRYSASRGIPGLRQEICRSYKRRYNVDLDPETEAVVSIGAKEGLSHLLMAVIGPGDAVVLPSPAYPIHEYGVVIADGQPVLLPMESPRAFLAELHNYCRTAPKPPKILIISFPHNPTCFCVDLTYMKEVVAIAKQYGFFVVHDFAYADLAFDGITPPSILEVPGAKDCCLEIFSMSKSYNMAGWRVGYCLGNRDLVAALVRIKSYLDYGTFEPIQIAAITALRECDADTVKIRELYQHRRDVLYNGLLEAGWPVEKPRGAMFQWARIPEPFRAMGSLDFAKLVLKETQVAVSAGIGFGAMGDGFVRFSLIEDKPRLLEATGRIGAFLKRHNAAVFEEAAIR